MRPDLTQALLKEVLHYDPETGVFTWRVSARPGRWAIGRSAGGLTSEGYLTAAISGRQYMAHRLAWLYVYGRWPEIHVDHINGNKADNRLSNLRECTQAQNAQNLPVRADNTAGLVGVKWYKRTHRWAAAIGLNGVTKHLGYFSNAEDAHMAYVNAKGQMHTFQPTLRGAS